MTEVVLQRTSIVPVVGELVAASVPEHVRVWPQVCTQPVPRVSVLPAVMAIGPYRPSIPSICATTARAPLLRVRMHHHVHEIMHHHGT
jgi:hypothetical protein